MQVGNSFMGMDIEQVRATTGSMEQAAQRIDDVVGRLTRYLENTAWTGADATRFRDAWNGRHAPALKKAAGDVRSSTGQVKLRIEAQIRASGGS